jgi:hypothetical protein
MTIKKLLLRISEEKPLFQKNPNPSRTQLKKVLEKIAYRPNGKGSRTCYLKTEQWKLLEAEIYPYDDEADRTLVREIVRTVENAHELLRMPGREKGVKRRLVGDEDAGVTRRKKQRTCEDVEMVDDPRDSDFIDESDGINGDSDDSVSSGAGAKGVEDDDATEGDAGIQGVKGTGAEEGAEPANSAKEVNVIAEPLNVQHETRHSEVAASPEEDGADMEEHASIPIARADKGKGIDREAHPFYDRDFSRDVERRHKMPART